MRAAAVCRSIPLDERVLAAMPLHGRAYASQIAGLLGASQPSVRAALRRLICAGRVTKVTRPDGPFLYERRWA